ncbi:MULTISPECIES: hypothetical protein [unclassified Streptomyces]|uniref:hypothetical protein n=1 Tax=unclassified Streptomyces TaxID=2593676 RepID=UPI002E144CB2|nr:MULTISPECIES: hypothetical protein [unclassified Streptomyces]
MSPGLRSTSPYVADSSVSGNTSGIQPYAGYWHIGGDELYWWPDRPTSNFFSGQIDETAI